MARMGWGRGLLGVVCVALLGGCADRERSFIADGMLIINPSDVNFDKVSVHNWKELDLTLTNHGRGPLHLLEVWTEGPEGAYRAEFVNESERILSTGETTSVRVRFTPKTGGALPGALVVMTDDRATPKSRVEVKGEGIDARAKITAPPFDFGRIEADSIKVIPYLVENPSILEVTVTPQPLGVDKDEFSSDAIKLAPGEKRQLALVFRPGRVGKKISALAISPCRGCGDEVFDVKAEALDRAVIAVPPDLDFGQIPIDRTADRKAGLTNISTEPMELQGLMLTARTDPSFTAGPSKFPVTLAPGQTLEWDLKYSPGHMGLAEGQSVFKVRSRRNPSTQVALRAFGGSPELCISPLNYDFGNVPVGAKVSVVLNIKNCGSSNGDPLQVSELTFAPSGLPGEDQFHLLPAQLPKTLAAGDEMTVKAYFEPTRPGGAAATLSVGSSAYAAARMKVGFSGTADVHEPCTVAVTPGAIDFGNVAPGRGAVLGVKVQNRGTDLCAVKNIRLAQDAGGVFRLPGGELDGFILQPGAFFSFMVAFQPPLAGGEFFGAAQVEPANPANPAVQVTLSGHSAGSCLSLAPPFLDFGVTRPDCPATPLKTNLANSCGTPITLSSLEIAPGTTDGEFTLMSMPTVMPRQLNPGENVTVEVNYLGQVRGLNLSPLFIRVAGEPQPLLVPLVGESSSTADQTDKFIQQDGTEADVLFVIDNTASMVEEHPRIVAAVPAFVSEALARNVDLHVAVTTTGIEPASNLCPGGAEGGEAGRLFPVDGSRPRILTQATPNLAMALQENVRVGQCAFVEKGFEAVRRALSSPLVDGADDPRTAMPGDGNLGFLRAEAPLAVVFVGDEDDHSPDDVDTYVKFLQTKKGAGQPGRATVYAIAPTAAACETAGGTGTRYGQAAAKTGGEVLSICATDYGPLFKNLAAKAFSPQDRFPLSSLPDTTTLAVTVDGAPATAGWTYDAPSNAVVFSARPTAGAKVQIHYRRVCPR